MDTYEFARQIRILALKSVYSAGCGHITSALSCADIIAVLYNEKMDYDPSFPDYPDRDRLVLSKGHACPALYAALALKGFFDVAELDNLRDISGFLEGMPSMVLTPGVDMSSGSLGMGVSSAAGMALAARINKRDYNVYAIVGDGEINEGQIWESFLFAAHNKLDNLCVFIDKNGLQLSGRTDDILNTFPLADKLLSFGAKALEIDGNDISEIQNALSDFDEEKERFTVIIANTLKGKGVSFMEDSPLWHGRVPDENEYIKALDELERR